MSIDILPNEIITIILKQLALQERILLRIVSTRWKVVIEDMCYLRRSLMLMQDIGAHFTQEEMTDHFDYDYLMLKPAGHDHDNDLLVRKPSAFTFQISCQLLASLFPGLDKLVLQFSKDFSRNISPILCDLLERFWPNLKSLTLIGDIAFCYLPHLKPIAIRICNAINAKTSLKCLNLMQNNLFQFPLSDCATQNSVSSSHELSVALSRLLHFSFTDKQKNDLTKILPLLVQCTSLEFRFSDLDLAPFKKIVEVNSQLRKVTHLRLRNIDENPFDQSGRSKIAFICDQFKQLNSLYLESNSRALRLVRPNLSFDLELIGHIAKLPKLVDLTLKYISLEMVDLNQFRVKIEKGTCPRIGTVRRLTIRELIRPVDFMRDIFDNFINMFVIMHNNFNGIENVLNVNEENGVEDILLVNPVDPVGPVNRLNTISDAGLFCKTLAFIFPNLQQLTISNCTYPLNDQFGDRFVSQLTDNLHYFNHLKKHKICSKYKHEPILYGRHQNRCV